MKYILLAIIALLSCSAPSSARVTALNPPTFSQAAFLHADLSSTHPRDPITDEQLYKLSKVNMFLGGAAILVGGGLLIGDLAAKPVVN